MKRLIQYSMQDGSEIVVEVDETKAEADLESSYISGTPPHKALVVAQETFEHAFHHVVPVLKHITSSLREIKPDTLDLELGIKFDMRGSAILASSSIEANITVKLHWGPTSRVED